MRSNMEMDSEVHNNNAPVISVVVPLYNEEGNIEHLLTELEKVLRDLALSFEVILVDDGSNDGTWSRIVELTDQFPEVVGVKLSRNFGHQKALLAGLSRAKGQAVISMDGDMQHPPELLPELIEAWQEGIHVVLTERHYTKTTSFFKRFTARGFYKVYSILAETTMHSGASDFRLLSRKALNALLNYRHARPFLRGAISAIGFSTKTIAFDAGERFSGSSKYSLSKMLRLAANGLLSHSTVPLRMGIWVGMLTGVLSLFQLMYVLVQYSLGNTVSGF